MPLQYRIVSWLVLIIVALSGGNARTQTAAPMKIVVPAPPGGALDTLTRLLADQVARSQGLTIVIEHRPGANTVIGTEAVSRAAPDGHTLLTNAPAAFVINPHLQKLNYDPLAGFEPICSLVSFPEVIVVNSALPYRTLGDLLGAARAKPGQLTLASIGPASIRAKLTRQGLYPVGTCGADFAVYIRKQYDEYGRIIREANLKAE